jgi:hypothetical protein
MARLALLVLGALFLGVYEGRPLVRQKMWRELAVFSAVLLSAFVVSACLVLDVQLPNPVKSMTYLLDRVFGLRSGF